MEELMKLLKQKQVEGYQIKMIYSFNYNRFGIIPLDRNGELEKGEEPALFNRLGLYGCYWKDEEDVTFVVDRDGVFEEISAKDYFKGGN